MLIALDYHPNAQIELGELLTVVNVSAANVVKDIRENIRNLVGGRMTHYEMLVAQAVNGAPWPNWTQRPRRSAMTA